MKYSRSRPNCTNCGSENTGMRFCIQCRSEMPFPEAENAKSAPLFKQKEQDKLKNKSNMEHLMIDIETMANESFSSIISLAAVEFDINTGETGKEFYLNISLQSCIGLGLIVNADTIMWWMNQSDQARKSLTGDSVSIQKALLSFSAFCNKHYQVWGNSARFDLGILQNAYNKAGLPIPWDFRKERCVRTLVSLKPEIKANHKYSGIGHNALADCYNQIAYCHKTWISI